MDPTNRRELLLRGGRLTAALGGAVLLSGCQLLGGDDGPACEPTAFDAPTLGVRGEACAALENTDAPGGWPQAAFTDGSRLMLFADDFEAETQVPINGASPHYRTFDQLPTGERLAWDDGPRITYGRQLYSEYTNSRSDYAWYFAFVTFDRPPQPGRSVLTLAWRRLDWDARPPEQDLRRVARSIVLR
ncbi:hypothetical protein ACQCX5_08835 [Propionibacteriaceae bacterium G57]|uniref:hypothetical protein n=1 Tax=Aestuariimicrobium sp. G57 TaxID=3418485 RepID=UPI003DA6D9DD